MNTFSLSKLFTVVLFVLVGGNINAETSYSSYEECHVKECEGSTASSVKYCDAGDAACAARYEKECVSQCINLMKLDDSKGSKNECKEALKDWQTKAPKGTRACGALDTSLGKSCSDQLKACKSKINGTFATNNNGGQDASIGFLKQIIQTRLSTNSDAIAQDAATGGIPCVKQYDAKTQKEDDKTFEQQKKDLEKRVKEEKDKQDKLTKQLSDKTVELQKKSTEIDKKTKEATKDLDKKLAEAQTAQDKREQDNKTALIKLDSAIIKEQQKITTLNFNIQNGLLDLTDVTITDRCKMQLESVRTALISKGTPSSGATTADPKQLEALRAQMGPGTLGTANMNSYLLKIKKACFEQENAKKQKLQLQYNQDLANVNLQIKDYQTQKDDLTKKLAIDTASKATSDTQTKKDKTDKETEGTTDKADLNNELVQFQTQIDKQMKTSQAESAKITEDIQTLVLKKNFDVTRAYDDAEDVVVAAENSRVSAYEACKCDGDGATSNAKNCGMLAVSPTNANSEADSEALGAAAAAAKKAGKGTKQQK